MGFGINPQKTKEKNAFLILNNQRKITFQNTITKIWKKSYKLLQKIIF